MEGRSCGRTMQSLIFIKREIFIISHVVFQKNWRVIIGPQIEVEADRFAAALLMPSEAVQNVISNIKSKRRVATIGQTRGLASNVIKEGKFDNVSNTAMVNRLIDLGIISNSIGYSKYAEHPFRP
jgi:Zn-dependent peptidase ImmA (M78 family)